MTTATAQPKRSWWSVKGAVLLALGFFLAFATVTRTFATVVADSNPDLALTLRSDNSAAHQALAERALQSLQKLQTTTATSESSLGGGLQSALAGRSSETAQQIVSENSLAALATAPLGAPALASLGFLAAFGKDGPAAQVFMEAAMARSLRQRQAAGWLLISCYDAHDYPKALRMADLLARSSPQNMTLYAGYLARLAEAPETSQAFAELIATNPPWRGAFFGNMDGNISDPRLPLVLLLRLKQSDVPPTDAEVQAYIRLLLKNDLFDLAQNAWLQFLSEAQLAKAGFVFNGGFDVPLSGVPLNWTPVGQGSPVVERRVVDDSQSAANFALNISFDGSRIEPELVRQLIKLAPGAYELQGRVRNFVRARRPLKWTVACVKGHEPLASGAPPQANGSGLAWAPFKLNFVVPTVDCPAQWLRLEIDARSPSETMATGGLWVDDVAVVRSASDSRADVNGG